MDINALDRSDTFAVHLDHPTTGEPLCRDDNGEQFWIEVYGTDSDHYRKVDRELVERNLARVRRTASLNSLTAEQAESQELERLCRTVRAWNLQIGDGYPEYTPELGREVFSNASLRFVREAVEAAQRNRANFFGS